MSLFMIAHRKQPALIVLPTVNLMEQWQEQIKKFLGFKAGIIGNGQFELRSITVATVQTLVKRAADAVKNNKRLKVCLGFLPKNIDIWSNIRLYMDGSFLKSHFEIKRYKFAFYISESSDS